jgi:hypothetical protein
MREEGAAGRLHLDHVRAVIGQQHGGNGNGHGLRRLDDNKMFQGAGHRTLLSRASLCRAGPAIVFLAGKSAITLAPNARQFCTIGSN